MSLEFSLVTQEQTPALTYEASENVIELLLTPPNGVAAMSPAFDGVVETSNNLATVQLNRNSLTILSFQRSSAMAQLEALTTTIATIAARAGANTRTVAEFPPWEPDMNSRLLNRSRKIYSAVFGNEPNVSIVHAGLECNVLRAKFPKLDMISLGPTIENAHSPDERLYIPSIRKVWDCLAALLQPE